MGLVDEKTKELVSLIDDEIEVSSVDSSIDSVVYLSVIDLEGRNLGVRFVVGTNTSKKGLSDGVNLFQTKPFLYRSAVKRAEAVAQNAYAHFKSCGISCRINHHSSYVKRE